MSKDNGGKDKNKSTKPSAEEQVVINEYMNRIAGAESGYTMTDKKTGKLIKNPGSSAKGPFQFMDATWGQMEKNLGKTLKRDNWGDNITAMKELSRVNINKLNKAGIPVNEKNLYMLHFLGDSGGVDYLKKMQDNPNELASKYVSSGALKQNENIFVDKKTGKHRTASEVFNLMSSKVSKPAKYDVVGSNGTDFNEINRADQSAGMPEGQLQGREFIEQNRGDSFEGETFRDNTNVAPIRPEGLPKIQEEGLKQFINPVERKRNSLGMIGDGTTYISPESKLAFTEEQQAEEDIENEEYARMGGHQMTMSNSFRNGGNPGKKKTVEQMMEEKKNALYGKKDSDGLNTSHSKYREDSELVDNKGKKHNAKGEEMVIGKNGSYSKKLDPKKINNKSSVDGKESSNSNDTGSKVKRTAEAVVEASVIGKALNKVPVAETAYDVYNLGNSFVEGDLRGMAANSIGALLPTVSGKTIEASISEFIPETSQSNRNRFKTALSISKSDNIGYLEKYGPGYMSNPEFIKNDGAKYGINEENKYESGGNLTEFDEGGSHEENPMGGIPQGMGSNGKMNTVEEGETKLKGSNYILSDTLKVNENDADDLQLPKDVIGMTYADASKFINRIAKENPGDSLIQKDSRESLDRLTMGNEKARLDYEQLMDNFGLAGDEPNEDQDQMFLGGIAGGNNLDMISNIGSSFMNGANKQAVPGTEGVDSPGGEDAAGYVNLATTGLGFANDIFGKSGVDSSGETRPAEVNQTGMALSGAAKGAQAGMMFGGVGAAVGGVIGLGAGVLKGAKAKKDMLRGRQRNDIKLSNQKISDFRLGGNIEEGEDPKIGNLSPEQAKDFELQRSWLNDWNKNRVINGKNINNNTDVPYSEDVYIDDLNYGKENKSTYGEFDSVSNRIVLDENYSNKQGIPAHELSHRFQKELKNGNSNNYENYINKPINDMIGPSGHLLGPYTSDPEENHAEINRFRYNNGIKPDQVISKEDMKGYDRKGYNLDHFDDDRLMGLLNTVADNGDDNKNNYARNGGNFENMNLSKTNKFRDGSYLDKYRTSKKEDYPQDYNTDWYNKNPSILNGYDNEDPNEGISPEVTEPGAAAVSKPYRAKGEDPLRYAGLAGAGLNYLEDMNAKPDYAELGRMDNRYNQKYVDIKALENNSRNEANSQISALGEMGLSKGQLISNMAGANFNKNRSVSDSMFRASEINRSEDRAAYDYGSRNDQFNISQSDKENELNQMEDQAIDDRKRESRDALFLSAGELGKENTYKNRIFNMTGGYDTTGRFQNINGKVYENVNGNLILVDSEKKEGKKRNGGLVGKYSEYLETKRKERESIESLNRI